LVKPTAIQINRVCVQAFRIITEKFILTYLFNIATNTPGLRAIRPHYVFLKTYQLEILYRKCTSWIKKIAQKRLNVTFCIIFDWITFSCLSALTFNSIENQMDMNIFHI
jgi:hypothetical protein